MLCNVKKRRGNVDWRIGMRMKHYVLQVFSSRVHHAINTFSYQTVSSFIKLQFCIFHLFSNFLLAKNKYVIKSMYIIIYTMSGE